MACVQPQLRPGVSRKCRCRARGRPCGRRACGRSAKTAPPRQGAQGGVPGGLPPLLGWARRGRPAQQRADPMWQAARPSPRAAWRRACWLGLLLFGLRLLPPRTPHDTATLGHQGNTSSSSNGATTTALPAQQPQQSSSQAVLFGGSWLTAGLLLLRLHVDDSGGGAAARAARRRALQRAKLVAQGQLEGGTGGRVAGTRGRWMRGVRAVRRAPPAQMAAARGGACEAHRGAALRSRRARAAAAAPPPVRQGSLLPLPTCCAVVMRLLANQ